VRGVDDNSPVKTVAVLTCVTAPVPPDALRPGYCGHDPSIYLARNIRRDLMPRFDQPADAPDPVKFAELLQRPWCHAGFFSFDVPQQSMPNYAQAYAQVLANAILLACCAGTRPEDRERLLINVIQIGIDHYGLVRHGHPDWAAHGGHGTGRKFPIVFAGAMLGDETMAHINRSFPQTHFGEDGQTAYGDCWTGAKVVFTGHSGIDAVSGIGRDFVRAGNRWGPYEHHSPDNWVPEEFRSEAYRRANTSTCFVAQALVLRTMKNGPGITTPFSIMWIAGSSKMTSPSASRSPNIAARPTIRTPTWTRPRNGSTKVMPTSLGSSNCGMSIARCAPR
jgi:hypothetical protein